MPSGANGVRRWSTFALVFAIVALVLAVVLPGFLAPRGAPVMTRADVNAGAAGLVLAPAPACTGVTGAEVTLSVPSAGTIVVTAAGRLVLNHSFGTEDTVGVFIGNASGVCTYPFAWIGEVSSSSPTAAFFDLSYSITTAFTVSAAGTYTLYLNAHMWRGWDAGDRLLTASVVAVFYPG